MVESSWGDIRARFMNQWIEVTDCSWDVDGSYPSRACVRNSAKTRLELMRKIQASGRKPDSFILFVGVASSVIEHHLEAAVA